MSEGWPGQTWQEVRIFPECVWKSLEVFTKRRGGAGGAHDQIHVVRNLTTHPPAALWQKDCGDTNGEAMVACRVRAGDLDKAGSSGD